MDTIEYAARYLANGWALLPLWGLSAEGCHCGNPTCSSSGKHPYSPLAPSGLKNATTDWAELEYWIDEYPSCNLGLATGTVSGIVVVDIDTDKEGFESLAALQDRYGNHPPTRAVQTGGGGLHLLFAYPDQPVRNSAGTLGRGIDVRGDGGYVVVPPSLHASGSRYEWDADEGGIDRPIQPMPEWITARAVRERAPLPVPRGASPFALPSSPIPDGVRNSTLASLAGRMRRAGADYGQIVSALDEANRRSCNPPLPRHEVETIARSMQRYPAAYHWS